MYVCLIVQYFPLWVGGIFVILFFMAIIWGDPEEQHKWDWARIFVSLFIVVYYGFLHFLGWPCG